MTDLVEKPLATSPGDLVRVCLNGDAALWGASLALRPRSTREPSHGSAHLRAIDGTTGRQYNLDSWVVVRRFTP